jgi:lysine 2,3-aminomutase
MSNEWRKYHIWRDISREQFEDSAWQDRNAVIRVAQLGSIIGDFVSPGLLSDIEAGVLNAGMSVRLNPYIICLIDWQSAEIDRIRRQFLPMQSELERDHPCLVIDSLQETSQSPVQGLVHRYPDKALFLATSVCPVYCQYCTRSYAVGLDTAAVQKQHVITAKNWAAALDYIRSQPQIEDIVISGGDVSRLKAATLTELGNALLDIPHLRRMRLATKAISVQPMKFLSDEEWRSSVVNLVRRGRSLFKDVCIHTHFNHPREITSEVEQVMRGLHSEGIVVRNQTVLLRGVNDDAATLQSLFKRLGAANIHPYYVYLCDMVKGTEHFRVSLATAQRLEKEIRGATAGFNTPLFVVDTPGGKRDVHSMEFYDRRYGVSFFTSPVVAPGRQFNYFDPLRTLGLNAREAWRVRRDEVIANTLIAAHRRTHPRCRQREVPHSFRPDISQPHARRAHRRTSPID